MLNADDPYTSASLHRLKETIRQRRPLVLWVGAGASRWAGLPSWHESAKQMRKTFFKSVADFPNDLAESHVISKSYPEAFQLCRDLDSALFYATLIKQFRAPVINSLYQQFANNLRGIIPVQVVTTNVDLCLEQQLGPIDVIERTDLERCARCVLDGSPFVGKLHGSISSVKSTVFTSEDYQRLKQDDHYTAAVKSIFDLASVVFLGYGLQDDYVLRLISESLGEHRLFGGGPHFLVEDLPGPPDNGVHRIAYRIALHPDHRAALTVLDFVQQAKSGPAPEASSAQPTPDSTGKHSSFYISDFRPSGTHITGSTLELARLGGEARINATVGLGFAQGELPSSETVAFHDLAVGLICFDRVFLPLSSLGLLHDRATHDVFWAMIDDGGIKFVDVVHDPLFVCQPDAMTGDISVVRFQDPQMTETRSTMSVIRRMLQPAPGREEEGEKRIESLNAHVVSFSSSEALDLAGMVRDALLLPRVSQLLGFSDYVAPNKIPRWLAHPTLRFAHLVQTGLICNQLRIRAARVPFGGTSLLSAAFSIKPAEQSLYEYASFVLGGAFGSNLSTFIEKDPRAFLSIIQFRESAEGGALRREIAERLETNEGTEFSAAIEGSLKKAIPTGILQAARNKFSTLLKTGTPSASAAAVWNDSQTDDLSLRLWRERSRALLLIDAKVRGVKSDSPCLCGSGDRLRECCLRPLR